MQQWLQKSSVTLQKNGQKEKVVENSNVLCKTKETDLTHFNFYLKDSEQKFLKNKYTKYVYSIHIVLEFYLSLILTKTATHINVLKARGKSACIL